MKIPPARGLGLVNVTDQSALLVVAVVFGSLPFLCDQQP